MSWASEHQVCWVFLAPLLQIKSHFLWKKIWRKYISRHVQLMWMQQTGDIEVHYFVHWFCVSERLLLLHLCLRSQTYNPCWIYNMFWCPWNSWLTDSTNDWIRSVSAPFVSMPAAQVWQWWYARLHFSPTSSQLYRQSLHSYMLH